LIIIAFGVSNLITLHEMRENMAHNRRVVGKMISIVNLLFRLDRDDDLKRLLLDAHVFERVSANMVDIEKRIAAVDSDFAAAADEYERTVGNSSDRADWVRLQTEVTRLQPEIERVLVLSRVNKNVEARVLMGTLESRFENIDHAIGNLINENRAEANLTMVDVTASQRKSQIILGILTLSGIAFALFAAIWVSRLLSHREDQMRRFALLLEERNRDLDAFAGRVAHDLRGPLTTINLAASMLAKREKEEGTSDILHRGVNQMEALIQDLLALSRNDAQLSASAAETAQVASAVAEDFKSHVTSANGIIRVDVEPATVRCSPGLLRQVLWNLSENSVKYRRSDVQLEIDIRGRAKQEAYEFSVSDNGSGMPPEEARRAFEPFFRGREHGRSTPGTGLGLSIVKRLIEANGGTVSIDSQPGRGTKFEINLPLGRAA